MKRAYVTLLASAADSPGVEALGASLRASGTREPLLVMATPDVPPRVRARLSIEGSLVRDIDSLGPSEHDGPSPLARPSRAFETLRAWQLTELDTVVFLAPDALVLRNVDELFERPELAAASSPHRPDQLDSGVMVLTPSEATFERMLGAVEALGTMEDRAHPANAQELLNELFPGWREASPEHHLPREYNLSVRHYPIAQPHGDPPDRAPREARILRYGRRRPWEGLPHLVGASSLWWNAYHAAHPETDRRWRRRIHAAEDWLHDRLHSHSPDQEPNSARPGG